MFTAIGTSQTSPHDDLVGDGPLYPGTLAGPWRVEHELGRGGMGTVYAVVHERIGKRAALKVAHARAITPWFTAERFMGEARVVNLVAHAGIVDIFETGVLADGRPYLVMERLDGVTLGQHVAAARPGVDEICAILLGICAPIRAAHAAHVIHRDLKLDNVFLIAGATATTPNVKVLDWGIAKIMTSDPTNTFAERLVGTPRYVSPEQARGATVAAASDVYSLGVMAYELFLDGPPFVAESAAELLVMHLRDLPPAPSARWPRIPHELESLLLAMLAKDADARPTIVEVAARLGAVRARLAPGMLEATVTAPVAAPAFGRRRARRAVALAAIALLGVGATWAGVRAGEVDAEAWSPPAAPPALALPPVPVAPAPAVIPPDAAPPIAAPAPRPRRRVVAPPAAPVVRAPLPTPVAPRIPRPLDPDAPIESYR